MSLFIVKDICNITGTSTEIYMVRPKRRDISCQTENVDIATIEHERWQDEEIVNLPSASMEVISVSK